MSSKVDSEPVFFLLKKTRQFWLFDTSLAQKCWSAAKFYQFKCNVTFTWLSSERMPDSFVDTHTAILYHKQSDKIRSKFHREGQKYIPAETFCAIKFNSTKRADVNLPLVFGSLFLWPDAITADETLFDYPPGQGHENFFFPDHVPIFSDELTDANFSAEARARCNGSLLCLYDSRETGDVDLGAVTEQERETFVAEQAGIGEFFLLARM